MMRLKFLALGFAYTLLTAPAFAMEPPSAKPSPTYKSSVLNPADKERLDLGLTAARRSDWPVVRRLRGQMSDPVARKLLLWREATTGMDNASFAELDRTLNDLTGWPRLNSVRENAEEKILNAGMSASERISWLERSGPISGEGKIALAEAYFANGRQDEGRAKIQDAWRNHPFPVRRQRELAAQYKEYLNAEDHIARTDYLLWTRQRSAASAMKANLSSDYDKLVDARIALAVGARGVDTKINAIPERLQNDPGLLLERSHWRRKRGRWEEAREVLLEIDSPVGVHARGLARIWDEKNLHLRRAIRDDRYNDAYRLASTHGTPRGVDFAEGEFNAGWMALRYLNRPEQALTHFRTLAEGVRSPISKSRGYFWVGEALSALGRQSEAQSAYAQAAQYSTTFYGQRAAERMGNTSLYLAAPLTVTADEISAFRRRELVKAMIMLKEADEDFQFRRISYHLDDQLETAEDYALLFDLTKSMNMTQSGVRGSKAGLTKGIVETGAAYPLFPFQLPEDRSQSAEPALVIALSRQESELNPKAISSANAYGLMQMLHGTARAQARKEGRPYRRSWLLDDPEYNARLGRDHLSDLIDDFNGSYILAIAGYNAGASRPERWITEYGDPRRGEIDPVDFIESIPFSETRNYVMRVLENTSVYRQRLAGGTTRIRLEEDLNRGR